MPRYERRNLVKDIASSLITIPILLSLFNCGGAAGTGTSTIFNGPSGVMILPTAGGTLLARSGNVALTMPSGAVSVNSFVRYGDPSNVLAQNLILPGTGISFSDLSLSSPASLTLKYSASSVPSGSTLGFYENYHGVWLPLPGASIDSTAHQAVGQVSALGTFALMTDFPTKGAVVAEAELASNGDPAVRVTWDPSYFVPNNSNILNWQVYRNDVTANPNLVAPAGSTSVEDTSLAGDLTWFSASSWGGGCNDVTLHNATWVAPVAGFPYHYKLELVYGINSTEIPGGAGTNPLPTCSFSSLQALAAGQATPLQPPVPVAVATVTGTQTFTYSSAVNPANPLTLQYVIQFSDSPFFAASTTYTTSALTSSSQNPITSGSINTLDPTVFPSAVIVASEVYWRVGVRNPADVPGPVPDATTGQRYIFGPPSSFLRG